MRLRYIQQRLDSVNFDTQKAVFGQDRHARNIISNLDEFKKLLGVLEDIPAFATTIESLKNSEIYSTGQDSVIVSAQDVEQLMSKCNFVVVGGAMLKKLLPNVIGGEENPLRSNYLNQRIWRILPRCSKRSSKRLPK